MSKTLNTNFEDTSGSGEVKLYENNLKGGKKYYGRFTRRTVDVSTLIARIKGKGASTNDVDMQAVAGHFKNAILDAVKNGESVNLFDLATVYIAPVGSVNGTTGENEALPLTVKITASADLKNAAKDVKISDSSVKDTSPAIENIYDQFSKKYLGDDDFGLTASMAVTITGKKLKVAGENSAIYLAPVDAKDVLVSDEGQWLKSPVIDRNLPQTVSFYLPGTAKTGTKYRIVIRTAYINGASVRKNYVDVVSGVVTVKSA